MSQEKSDEEIRDDMLFKRVKDSMIEMCENHEDIIEYRIFKEKIKKANSFSDLQDNNV